MQFDLHLFRVDGIILEDLLEPLIVIGGVHHRQSLHIREAAKVVARQDAAVPDGSRQGVDPDPELRIGFLHAKKIVRPDSAIPVFTQAGDEADAALIDAAGSGIQDTVIDVHAQRFADDQVSGATLVTEDLYFHHPAFEADLAFLYHRRPDERGGLFGKPRLDELRDFLGIIAARKAYLLDHREIDDIDDDLGNFQYVVQRMFG